MKGRNGTVYDGPVLILVEPDCVLNADAVLVAMDGWWGGLVRMYSIAGAEIVQEAQPARDVFMTIGDSPLGSEFTSRRCSPDCPDLRVTGKGAPPFTVEEEED